MYTLYKLHFCLKMSELICVEDQARTCNAETARILFQGINGNLGKIKIQ